VVSAARRLIYSQQIHPDVQHLTLDALGPADTLSELDDRLMGPQIVATTCLSIDQ
jgi:DNA replication ATP-dependent helicase Dna2